MNKTVREIIEMHISPLVKEDHYNDVEQAIEELERLIAEKSS